MFHDLSTEREVQIPVQAEKRERKLLELIGKRQKPIVLLIDEAHDLTRKTLIELKRLTELVQEIGGSCVGVGQPPQPEKRVESGHDGGNRLTHHLLCPRRGERAAACLYLVAAGACSELPEDDIVTEAAAELLTRGWSRHSRSSNISLWLSKPRT